VVVGVASRSRTGGRPQILRDIGEPRIGN